jgi:hypothetical protein
MDMSFEGVFEELVTPRDGRRAGRERAGTSSRTQAIAER